MATRKAAASTQTAYDKSKIAAFLKDQATNAVAQVKRTKLQILEQDFATELADLKAKGFTAKQVAQFFNAAGGGLEVSEAAVREYYSNASKAPAAKPVAAAPIPAPVPAVAAVKK